MLEIELVKKAKEGDREAFAQLYTDVSRKLYSTAFYLLGRKEDAEDIVMDTVTDAFRSIQQLRDDSAFDRWIMRILINKAKKRRGNYIDEPAELDDNIALVSSLDSEEKIIIWKAMKMISDEDRRILILGIIDGYKSEEIAQIMQMNTNTIRSKRKRALQKIRTILENGGYKNDR
ncbi:MAG: sigma-70 family RNA polymerase sigma factor [Oscillospiraceae bacterium]|nr:sigma-70 family RNA polymerase sigma factor [Oscillospiraceae bacterium]